MIYRGNHGQQDAPTHPSFGIVAAESCSVRAVQYLMLACVFLRSLRKARLHPIMCVVLFCFSAATKKG